MSKFVKSTLWMVRHTAVDLPPGTCYGRSDVALRATFPDEAALVRRQLDGMEFDAVWSSPLSRCTRLADACGYTDAVRDERLREIDFGGWEGWLFDEIDDPALQVWYDDYLHARPTGGETFDEQRTRVSEFLDELRGRFRRVLVFTHGGVILAASIHAGLYAPEEAFSHIISYGGVLKIEL